MAIKIEVYDGEIGLNDAVLWHSEKLGVRTGTVIKLTEKFRKGWSQGVRNTSVTVKCNDKLDNRRSKVITLTRLDKIIPNRSISSYNTVRSMESFQK